MRWTPSGNRHVGTGEKTSRGRPRRPLVKDTQLAGRGSLFGKRDPVCTVEWWRSRWIETERLRTIR